MRHLVTLAALILSAVLLVPACARADDAEAKAAAEKAARAWLALVDDGQYAKSWENAAALFRNAVPEEHWTAALTARRKPLGAVLSRTIKSANYSTTLEGGPEGQYVVIEFATTFANRQHSSEVITPMRESDGSWRVAGYHIF
jgi:hypothetical protein